MVLLHEPDDVPTKDSSFGFMAVNVELGFLNHKKTRRTKKGDEPLIRTNLLHTKNRNKVFRNQFG